MSVSMLMQVKVTDPARFEEYIGRSKAIAAEFGAELLYQGKKNKAVFGMPLDNDLIVLVRFPDLETADRWYNSDGYQAIVPLREEGSVQVAAVYEDMN